MNADTLRRIEIWIAFKDGESLDRWRNESGNVAVSEPHADDLRALLALASRDPEAAKLEEATVERRGIVRDILYRKLPAEIDANVCRTIADEIIAALGAANTPEQQ